MRPFAERREIGGQRRQHRIAAGLQRAAHRLNMFRRVFVQVFVHQHRGQMAGAAAGQNLGVGLRQRGFYRRRQYAKAHPQPATQQLGIR